MVAIVDVADGGTPPEVLASDMPLQCCQGQADKVALMFIVVVGQWAAEVVWLEVQIWYTLDLAAVSYKRAFKVFSCGPLARALTGHH